MRERLRLRPRGRSASLKASSLRSDALGGERGSGGVRGRPLWGGGICDAMPHWGDAMIMRGEEELKIGRDTKRLTAKRRLVVLCRADCGGPQARTKFVT